MPRRKRFGPLAIATLATAFGGCSFAFVNGPPPNHRTSPFFTCTSGNGAPILDTVAATIGLIDAASFAADGLSDSSTTTGSKTANMIVLGGGAALLAASAAYGYKKTSECRAAEADLLRRTPVYTAPSPFAPHAPQGPQAPPQVPYDPWVAHPAAVPVTPGASPGVEPPGAAPPAPGSSPWDAPSPGK
jgi:hypothetical protein